MEAHQQRVLDEKAALDIKREALDHFIMRAPLFETLAYAEQRRLMRQLDAMTLYSDILGQRIAAFKP